VTIGRGKEAFAKASDALLSLKIFDKIDWVKIAVHGNCSIEAGSEIASVTRFYRTPLWSVNPCRVVSVVRDQPAQLSVVQSLEGQGRAVIRYSEVVFSTLQGHVIAGEEALRVYAQLAPVPAIAGTPGVSGSRQRGATRGAYSDISEGEWEGEEEVVFEVVSYSRGAGLLGALGMPLLRPLQSKFGQDCCAAMCALVRGEGIP
jgi:uncharacterized protein (UPF0548 family)